LVASTTARDLASRSSLVRVRSTTPRLAGPLAAGDPDGAEEDWAADEPGVRGVRAGVELGETADREVAGRSAAERGVVVKGAADRGGAAFGTAGAEATAAAAGAGIGDGVGTAAGADAPTGAAVVGGTDGTPEGAGRFGFFTSTVTALVRPCENFWRT